MTSEPRSPPVSRTNRSRTRSRLASPSTRPTASRTRSPSRCSVRRASRRAPSISSNAGTDNRQASIAGALVPPSVTSLGGVDPVEVAGEMVKAVGRRLGLVGVLAVMASRRPFFTALSDDVMLLAGQFDDLLQPHRRVHLRVVAARHGIASAAPTPYKQEVTGSSPVPPIWESPAATWLVAHGGRPRRLALWRSARLVEDESVKDVVGRDREPLLDARLLGVG